jgi:hypothetical protein
MHSFSLIFMVLLLLAKGEYCERCACVVQIFVEAARRLETSRRIEDIRSNRIQYSKGCRNLQEETKETLARSLGKENAFAFGYVVAGCAAEKRCTG